MPIETEYDKMIAGELYDAGDPELTMFRARARAFTREYNQSPDDKKSRATMLEQFLGKTGVNIDIQPPFYCDYGGQTKVGNNFFANFNCIFLDCNFINIGDNVFLGPNVQVYTASHPLIAAERSKGPELAYAINIGSNVWIGGGSIICPGVTIGDNTTIGAGSIVVKDIPANVLAAGNPCKVIRSLP